MTALNSSLSVLTTALMRGIYLTVAILFIFLSLSIPVQAQEKPEVKYAQVGDVKLAYYLKGKGDPMILIMGYAATMSAWDPALLGELSKNNQLIIFDNRGAGLSTDTKENYTTIPQMADDAAGLVKALGFKKVNVFSWSMGARIGQQLVIKHPELVNKVILCAPNPGGKYQIAIDKKVGEELNNPSLSPMENFELLFPITPEGKAAAKVVYGRFMAAKAAGTIPDDFVISKEAKERQVRARITLWNADNQNYQDLKKIKVPVLVADGREDIIDNPKNSVVIANQIPFAWLAFYEGGHAFLFQSYKKLSETVNVFLQKD
ncbi:MULTISPECIES: alpha/beta fold hydrolase [unclassified Polynucleobacter]|uniref:alpha/beta fold hydrolase n=1 Tax=unclassified Polynucleobacter TaxID=2640945 RepID=UPI001C0C2ABC|nr:MULTISPECIES: alpha/beta hydrolase [unclassified Polynucleobacter]MBU3549287.1 alpha/beta hydrolase [Polynucleobacter sp. P1-05-14]MEA9567395.1 alpha/beta hydrolase [Polynucleobacter sp. AP-Nickl1-40-C4]